MEGQISAVNKAEQQQHATQPVAVMEKDTNVAAAMQKPGGSCVMMPIFGVLVLVGLIIIIILQAKTISVLKKHIASKKR